MKKTETFKCSLDRVQFTTKMQFNSYTGINNITYPNALVVNNSVIRAV